MFLDVSQIRRKSLVPKRPVGFEPTTFGFEVRERDSIKGTRSKGLRQGAAAVAELLPNDTCQTPPISAPLADPDLAAVVDAWPALPEAIKAGILAMVNAASESGK